MPWNVNGIWKVLMHVSAMLTALTLSAAGSQDYFVIGNYQNWSALVRTGVDHMRSSGFSEVDLDYLFALHKFCRGLNLSEVRFRKFEESSDIDLSIRMGGVSQIPSIAEFLYESSLLLWPANPVAAKNYAHHLEHSHQASLARSLLGQSFEVSGDLGSRLQHAFTTPALLISEEGALVIFQEIVNSALNILLTPYDSQAKMAEPFFEVRALQTHMQYLGYSPGLLTELYAAAVVHSSVPLHTETERSLLCGQAVRGTKKVRIGIVSEQVQNSSPGLCLSSVFESLMNHHADVFEVVFFDRPSSSLHSSEVFRRISSHWLELDEADILRSRQLILESCVDVLLYMALPTEKLTQFLSHHRLAPVQIQFGVGHPVSSGSPTVDFTVISRLMLWQQPGVSLHSSREPLLHRPVNASLCLDHLRDLGRESHQTVEMHDLLGLDRSIDWRSWSLEHNSNHSLAALYSSTPRRHPCALCQAGPSSMSSTEQIVLFDSLGYHMHDLTSLYPGFQPLQFFHHGNCEDVNALLFDSGLGEHLSASELGCRDFTRTVRLYFAFQIPRKLHPGFDKAIAAIAERDRMAKFIVYANAEALIPRWKISLSMTEDQIRQRFLFVRRLSHVVYLHLLSLSSVFLNTFPFGAGITSSDALSVCVPVVVAPTLTGLVNMAQGQVQALPASLASRMTAHSLDDYVRKAVQLAADEGVREVICDNKHLLFGEASLEKTSHEWYTFLSRVSPHVAFAEY